MRPSAWHPGISDEERRSAEAISGGRRRYDHAKRLMDVLVATAALVLTAPLQALVACLVRRDLGSPVLFKQLRPGKDEKLFELVKFRTMRDLDPAAPLSDADRLTPLGSKLRSWSLDELPTLWNVLKGDMSLVGPRPLLVAYLDRYSAAQRRRHEVRPGVTGLAQVSGRNAITWEEKFAKDLEYIDRRSLCLDLWVLYRTVVATIRREGITAENSATMPEFLGARGDQRATD
jgi:lipopolysaccharide/colanic/teichoic acid biosynthesis glycosyltransferase